MDKLRDPADDSGEAKEPGRDGIGDGSALRTLFVKRYADLTRRLARRLGSQEWAEDALHDTYLRLAGGESVGTIRNPLAYLFRMAINTALDQRRAEQRRLTKADIDAVINVPDDAPGPLQVVENQREIVRLSDIIAKLPARRREILLAARVDGMTRREIAARFGISVSMVEQELRAAQEYCASRFKRKTPK
ncbi:RNA polymerase sigma factor [Bradyrhizobium sp. Arg237L]|uniref:RNA polymerase sigma factor n=1 Tax=Bradyrhizobium sp. Arg237L TaxID=3003352 RepID=UPI00249E5FDD|nr:RNA polymerase sigma factor [Bradyrhizobium sp. Arg237L]MDI4237337.1 RNA polymerase sigma factor [Bradyrhizobium sp. Arg237L]